VVDETKQAKLGRYRAVLPGAVLCLVVYLLDAQSAHAQSRDDAIGYQSSEVKAAFLYRLPRFIRWQDGRQAKHFCFDEKSEVMAIFKLLLAAKDNLATVSLLKEDDHVTTCDVRFVGSDKVSNPAPNQLLISDRKDFATRGGMIELTRKGARVGLNVNLDSLKAGNLKASSQLLKLANVVGGD